jgi:photosystem II stability/assembly factor-like uncharacterized protein
MTINSDGWAGDHLAHGRGLGAPDGRRRRDVVWPDPAGPWSIREIRFVTSNLGWAAGGNIYSGGGGLYFSSDGGQTWSLDLNAGAELDACEQWGASPGHLSLQVWCSGYDSSFAGKVYTLKLSASSGG